MPPAPQEEEAHPYIGYLPGTHTRHHYKAGKGAPRKTVHKPFSGPSPVVVREGDAEGGWVVVAKQATAALDVEGLGEFGSSISFQVNGQAYTLEDVDPEAKLANFLRFEAGLTGTKIGCGEGGCGACTVVVTWPGEGPTIVNSCLRPVASLDGAEVTTTEGIGSKAAGYHPVQSKLADCDGTQCGYCTPGMVMSMYGLLQQKPNPSHEEVENIISGNICRCTGYRPIFTAFQSFAASKTGSTEPRPAAPPSTAATTATAPPRTRLAAKRRGVRSVGLGPAARAAAEDERVWYNPSSVAEVFSLLEAAKAADQVVRLTCGNTSIGVAKYYDFAPEYDAPTVFVNVARLPELSAVSLADGALVAGSSVTLSALIRALEGLAGNVNLRAVAAHLSKVAHTQVRDVGSWAGNLLIAKAHAQFPSDVGLLLTACGASVTLSTAEQWACRTAEASGEAAEGDAAAETTVAVEDFLSGAASFDPTTMLLTSVSIPTMEGAGTLFESYKVMKRNINTHAIVNAAFRLDLGADGTTVEAARLVWGNQPNEAGEGEDTAGYTLAPKTTAALIGSPLTLETWEAIRPVLHAELAEKPDELAAQEPISASEAAAVAAGSDGALEGNGALLTHPVEDPEARRIMAENLLFKAFLTFIRRTQGEAALDPALLSVASQYERAVSSGNPKVPAAPDLVTAPVGQAIHKIEGRQQASGEVKYTTDMALPTGTLFGAPVLASQVGCAVLEIDATEALAMAGVAAVISAQDVEDVGASNSISTSAIRIFATAEMDDPVRHHGEFVALVLADDPTVASRAAAVVKVTYSEKQQPASTRKVRVDAHGSLLTGVAGRGAALARQSAAFEAFAARVLTEHPDLSCPGVQEVRLKLEKTWAGMSPAEKAPFIVAPHPSLHGVEHKSELMAKALRKALTPEMLAEWGKEGVAMGARLHDGDASKSSVQGTMKTGGQKHFYLETQSAVAVPGEDGAMTIHCSLQVLGRTKTLLAATLKIAQNKLVVSNTRCGGCYGGKAFLHVLTAAASGVAALKMNRPVLLQLSRNDDFMTLGGRPPSTCDFEAEVDVATGKISSLTLNSTVDAGFDDSGGVDATSLNAYDIGLLGGHLNNTIVTTATPLNTIMRAPGDAQGTLYCEAAVECAVRAAALGGGLTPLEVQEANLDQDTFTAWNACKAQAGTEQLAVDIAAFNAANKFRKRGMWVSPVKFAMNTSISGQTCMLAIGSDGSVSVNHSGLENGQGLNTKVEQVVISELSKGVSGGLGFANLSTVVPKTSTDFQRASDTWASTTSDACAFAAIKACEQIVERLAPFTEGGTASWTDAVAAAADADVMLSATGEHRQLRDGGEQIVYCVACSVMEVDCLTGEYQHLSVDLVYDCGISMSPAVDIGQVEGCFIQAAGMVLTEEVERDPADKSRMLNAGTWDYKPPSSLDIPIRFDVTFLEDSVNTLPANVLGSKASGEPPIMLGMTPFFALKMAIYAARADLAGETGYFRLDAPAAPQRVMQACLATPSAAFSAFAPPTAASGAPLAQGARRASAEDVLRRHLRPLHGSKWADLGANLGRLAPRDLSACLAAVGRAVAPASSDQVRAAQAARLAALIATSPVAVAAVGCFHNPLTQEKVVGVVGPESDGLVRV